jgi:hypothetical protein
VGLHNFISNALFCLTLFQLLVFFLLLSDLPVTCEEADFWLLSEGFDSSLFLIERPPFLIF